MGVTYISTHGLCVVLDLLSQTLLLLHLWYIAFIVHCYVAHWWQISINYNMLKIRYCILLLNHVAR